MPANTDLSAAARYLDLATERLRIAAKATFPIGSIVSWKHGSHIRSAVVVGYAATGFNLVVCNRMTGNRLQRDPRHVF